MTEIYKDIPQYPAYRVSESGKVLNLKSGSHVRESMQTIKGRPTGYIYVSLVWECYSDVTERWEYLDNTKRIAVHRLVCMAFHGLPPEGKPWVNHIDGNKANNHYTNLEWTSISENIKHAFNTGLHKAIRGAEHWAHGKTFTKATKAKMSVKKQGENHPKFKGWFVVNGRKYASAREAAQKTGIDAKKVKRLCINRVDGCYFLDKNRLLSV